MQHSMLSKKGSVLPRSTAFAFYSRTARASFGRFTWETPEGNLIDITALHQKPDEIKNYLKKYPDAYYVGKVTTFISLDRDDLNSPPPLQAPLDAELKRLLNQDNTPHALACNIMFDK